MPDWSPAALAARAPIVDGPRYYAKTRHVWIYPTPDTGSQWIGFLWTGGSVRLKSNRLIAGNGCLGFYAVEPTGFICGDGTKRGTIDPNDSLYRQLLHYAPQVDSPWLHRYGQVVALTRYFQFPGDPHAPSDSNVFDLDFGGLVPSVHEAHATLIERSTLAYSAQGHHAGKDWLLTSDYALVEKSKVTPYPDIHFHGLHLTSQVSLPIAYFRGKDRPRYEEVKPGEYAIRGAAHPRLSWIALTGQRKHAQGEEWLETMDHSWIKATDATVPTPSSTTPWGDPVGSTGDHQPNGRATWIEVSILGGWLIAYEGSHPVFTTLISPGSGGLPTKGKAAIDTYSTPMGRFQINGKFVSSTMTGPTGLIHSEVPYAQNFADLYAIHTAYWHDNWGYPMSGGCVNVSPIDGHYLFHWTDPPIAEGWYGKRWLPSREASTIVVIHQ